ncbi:hypothetical protein OEG86_15805 [Hoeflea alexandrii]|uniref:hypothetical protein n=1 Tax=Hoeflea alexandrii TaxID=288436 RepID=UPI002270E64F|nr:hypothetical protein [Hoeflea alexandrii]MCY0153461.1 hypothetical protein [Hoeflea alexandrii]
MLIEGGADAREAALGSSFADLIKAGDTLDPVETTQAAGASPSPVAPQPADPTAIQPVRQPREPVSPAASTVEDVSAQLPNRLEPVSEAELIPPSRTEKLDVSVSDVSVTLPTPEMTRPVKPAESWKPVEDPLPVETAIPANVPTPVAKPEQPKQPPRKTAGNIKSKSEVNSKAWHPGRQGHRQSRIEWQGSSQIGIRQFRQCRSRQLPGQGLCQDRQNPAAQCWRQRGGPC